MTDNAQSSGGPIKGRIASETPQTSKEPSRADPITPEKVAPRPEKIGPEVGNDVAAWQSIRASIGIFDQLVMTLLTQGTLVVFAALGLIYGSPGHLRPLLAIVLGGGVFFGVFMLNLGVARYATSISVAVAAAEELENRIWPDKNAPNRITHRLADYRLAAAHWLGRAYYRIWSFSLVVLVGVVVVVLSIDLVIDAPKAHKEASAGKGNIGQPAPTESIVKGSDVRVTPDHVATPTPSDGGGAPRPSDAALILRPRGHHSARDRIGRKQSGGSE